MSITGSMNKIFLKTVLVLAVFVLVSCEQQKMEIDKIHECVYNLSDSLLDLNKVTKEDLKNLWLPLLSAIEKVNLNDLNSISDEAELMGACFTFSNSLTGAAKRLFVEKQDDSTKELLLQISTRITNFSRKLRDIAVTHRRREKVFSDTFWLTVSYNDNQTNVWNLINSIVFDTCDDIEVVEYYLSEIAERLNESVDSNVYFNILEEIGYGSPDLLNNFLEKVKRLGGGEKITNPAAKKVFNYIDSRVKEKKASKEVGSVSKNYIDIMHIPSTAVS